MNFIKEQFSPAEISLTNGKKVQPPKRLTPYIVIVLLIVTAIAVYVTGFNFGTIFSRGGQFWIILGKMFPPNLEYSGKVWGPLVDTVLMSFMGAAIGSFVAIPFAVLSSQNITTNNVLRNIIRFILSILRTIPTLILAIIATYIFGIGTFAGTLAIGIFSFAIVAKMLYEQIETVDMGPFEAMESLGASKVQAFVGAIMPQILPTYFSICLYALEINVRYAAILGYVGAGGIGLLLDERIGWRYYEDVGTVLLMLFVTVVIIESTSRFLRERLS